MTFPEGSHERFPGRVRREIVTETWYEGDLVVFQGELHDRWMSDDGTAEDDVHRYRLRFATRPPDLEIVEAAAKPLVLPYEECPLAAGVVDRLVGLSLARGFRRRVEEVLGSVEGCTHLLTLAQALWASQVVSRYLVSRPDIEAGSPRDPHIAERVKNSCRGWREDSSAYLDTLAGAPYGESWRAEAAVGEPRRRPPGAPEHRADGQGAARAAQPDHRDRRDRRDPRGGDAHG